MHTRFPLKTIAFQAGLSLATVDRVVHERPGVREITRNRVAAALAELERQAQASALAGQRVAIDVVLDAPNRFSRTVRSAFEAELPAVRSASITARFHSSESMTTTDVVALLTSIRKRGSHGVVLKAQDTDDVREAAQRLINAKIPVITYVTDIRETARTTYVGIDNIAAGKTAAWLVGPMLSERPCSILLTVSSALFEGEQQREQGFRQVISTHFPALKVVTVAEGKGVNASTERLVEDALLADESIRAVYSAGGGNKAVLDAFANSAREIAVFAAHDLDRTNQTLIKQGRLSFVLHHDLREDARSVLQQVLQFHRLLPNAYSPAPSRLSITTPP